VATTPREPVASIVAIVLNLKRGLTDESEALNVGG
jgi:hypothetical protein